MTKISKSGWAGEQVRGSYYSNKILSWLTSCINLFFILQPQSEPYIRVESLSFYERKFFYKYPLRRRKFFLNWGIRWPIYLKIHFFFDIFWVLIFVSKHYKDTPFFYKIMYDLRGYWRSYKAFIFLAWKGFHDFCSNSYFIIM